MAGKRKKRKPTKFKPVTFKITYQQKKRVDAFCRDYGTTPITMYKKAIMAYLATNGYGHLKFPQDQDISPNQMSIFDIVEDIKP